MSIKSDARDELRDSGSEGAAEAARLDAADAREEAGWAAAAAGEGYQRVRELEAKLAHMKRVLGALVGTLPKCDECTAPATRAFKRGGGRWCDEHGKDMYLIYPGTPHESTFPSKGAVVPEYPRAEPLRAAVALLKEKP
jgi:hypothetical protein